MKQHNYQGVLQQPLGSGFNARSTAQDVINGIDLKGKVVIITGGYAGIGLETTKVLSEAGATVIVPARDQAKAAKNLKDIVRVEPETIDLMDPASIDAFAARFLASGRPLHLLINNAGIMWVPLRRDSRGFESQLATNHLGHFQLTARLWPALKQADGARVVNVSSFGHQIAPFDFDDPNFTHTAYETLIGYGRSKTANNLFTVELDKRGSRAGVRSYSLHPGSVYGTDLGREAPMELYQQMGTHDANGNIYPEVEKKLKTLAQGAATTVWCATSPALNNVGGVYCEDADIAVLDEGNIVYQFDEPSTLTGVRPYSLDQSAAQRLWILSEQMLQINFPAD
ncbi:NAD(P)-dependent dehydrogenase, short-chain alcohol dehydrogenase family [Chitinophaga sp. YR627]|uniref:SDR family NAD(P)-dependent oxidoreductase n=1 Tax=Chitinophaga sp. YR627 TaxID=1881041 RepID=UPI0008DEDE25|nr:SDR family NAD(P)-dependent oxidoreductase [Chitinophaga sp. YR627]SFO21582.1 NAD(P)-dependent dehydrogenase, short-chain alcohol dehydrogenase family [Chitinophaga sp. YR627]